MTCTVRGYPSLQNYKDEVEKNPDALRPDCCPECKQPKLWLHGFYNRLIIRKDASRTIDEEAKILKTTQNFHKVISNVSHSSFCCS